MKTCPGCSCELEEYSKATLRGACQLGQIRSAYLGIPCPSVAAVAYAPPPESERLQSDESAWYYCVGCCEWFSSRALESGESNPSFGWRRALQQDVARGEKGGASGGGNSVVRAKSRSRFKGEPLWAEYPDVSSTSRLRNPDAIAIEYTLPVEVRERLDWLATTMGVTITALIRARIRLGFKEGIDKMKEILHTLGKRTAPKRGRPRKSA